MNRKKFIIIGIFWIVIIGGLIASKEFTLQTGDEILLKTKPVDPRDLFRGDYVILRYDINTINTNKIPYSGYDFKEGDKIYILLSIDSDGVGELATIHRNKPNKGAFLKGIVRSAHNNRLNIEYGIESYFVPEKRGKELERNLGKIYTKIAVDDFGNAIIKSLILNGKDITLD